MSNKKSNKSKTDNLQPKDYTDAMVQEGRRLLGAERDCDNLVRKNKEEALLYAFEFGRLVWEDVLGGQRGARNKKSLLNYLKDAGYLDEAAKKVPTSIYCYKYIYRGAGSETNVRQLGLNREYYEVLGQKIVGDDLISAGFVEYLRHNPVTTAGVPDAEKLKDIATMIQSSRKALSWNPKLSDLESFNGGPFDWQRLGSMPLLGLQDCLLQGTGKNMDENVRRDTIWEAIRLEDALAQVTGQDFRGVNSRRAPWLKKISESDSGSKTTAKGMSRRLDRQRKIRRITSSANKQICEQDAESDSTQKLFCGDARCVLAVGNVCEPGTLDLVITDPPYSRKYYAAYRPENEVAHDMEETPADQAALVAEVASTLLEQGLHRPEGFAWIQFCPMALVHEFAPPLLDAFKQHVEQYDYQVAVWNKLMTPKVQGTARFTPQLEAMLIVSVGRPFNDVDESGKPVQMQSPLIECRPTNNKDDFFWKPKELIKKLIHLFSYGEIGSNQAASQIILDPFGGAGSTAVAAIEMGRDYRLIESHEGQFELAKAEVESALASASPASTISP